MLNHITIMGRLTRDPEMRRTNSGVAVTSFTIACDRDFGQNGEKETDFIEVTAWRNTAEVVADNVYFADSKKDDSNSYSGQIYSAPSAVAPASDFAMLDDFDSQLPF